MFNSLIIGRGEIGSSVEEVIRLKDKVDTYDKARDAKLVFDVHTDVLHICFPYSDKFVDQVNYYIKECKPWHVIIWSTVPIGTTREIKGAVHSPVEGRHPKLARSIRDSIRWIGINDEVEGEFFKLYFKEHMIASRVVERTEFTEFLKLRSTSKYGINLVWTDYEANVASDIGMDFELLKDFDRDYNKLYHNIDMNWAQRYILDPPRGKIGGHCVIPNAELLDEQFPCELLKIIKEYK